MFLVKYLLNQVENANSDTVITESTRTTNESCQSHKNLLHFLQSEGESVMQINNFIAHLYLLQYDLCKRDCQQVSDRYWRLSYGDRHLSQRIFADISSSAIAKSRQKQKRALEHDR